MTEVLASAPIGVPVIRMRAEILYRALNSNAHRAVEELLALDTNPERIAATLGLRTDRIDALIAELDGSGGQRVRTIRVWIDPAHGAVMPGDGDLHLTKRDSSRGIPTLPILRPAAEDLDPGAFASATSTADERVAIDAVRSLQSDLAQHGASHNDELLLPDTHLLVTYGSGDDPEVQIQWHGSQDPDLTTLANQKLLGPLALDATSLTQDAHQQTQQALYETHGLDQTQAFQLPLDAGSVRDRVLDLAAQATEQLVLAIGQPIAYLEPWIAQALAAAAERGVDTRLLLTDPEQLKRRPNSQVRVGCYHDDKNGNSNQGGFTVIRDATRALAHSHAYILGAGWDYPDLTAQACLAVHDPNAVRILIQRLGITPPPPPHPPQPHDTSPPTEEIAQDALRRALEHQRAHLPTGITAAITEDDLQTFHEQAEREWIDTQNPGEVKQLAAGVAWERTVYTLIKHITETDPTHELYKLRWTPPKGNIDIDIVLRDREQKICWLIDAKHGRPKDSDIGLMRYQIKLARDHNLAPAGWHTNGLIVHPTPPDQHTGGYTQAISHNIKRTTLAELPEILLAKRLPGAQPSVQINRS